MTEKYPTWLENHVKEWAEKRLTTVTLCSITGSELLEVWYYGEVCGNSIYSPLNFECICTGI